MLTTKQAADRIGVSTSWMRAMCRKGQIAFSQKAKDCSISFDPEEVERVAAIYEAQRRKKAEEAAERAAGANTPLFDTSDLAGALVEVSKALWAIRSTLDKVIGR